MVTSYIILSFVYPSDGSEDPATTPFLEIADQKGNPLQIPDSERKVNPIVFMLLWRVCL